MPDSCFSIFKCQLFCLSVSHFSRRTTIFTELLTSTHEPFSVLRVVGGGKFCPIDENMVKILKEIISNYFRPVEKLRR